MSATRVLILSIVLGAASFFIGHASRAAVPAPDAFYAFCTGVMPQCKPGTIPKCICAGGTNGQQECFWICN